MKNLINTFYPKCSQFKILTDDSIDLTLKPTRKNIIEAIKWLVTDLKNGESAKFLMDRDIENFHNI